MLKLRAGAGPAWSAWGKRVCRLRQTTDSRPAGTMVRRFPKAAAANIPCY